MERLTRDELRDEIWDAMMNRMDIDVSTTDLADAALERIESLGIIHPDAIITAASVASPLATAQSAGADDASNRKGSIR